MDVETKLKGLLRDTWRGTGIVFGRLNRQIARIANRSWLLVELRYFTRMRLARKTVEKIHRFWMCCRDLKTSKLLIMTALGVEIITIAAVWNSMGFSPYNLKVDFVVAYKVLTSNALCMTRFFLGYFGFIGALFLLIRKEIGVWIFAAWAALQVVPFYYSTDAFNPVAAVFGALNGQILQASKMWFYHADSRVMETLGRFVTEVRYDLPVLGIGVNIVGLCLLTLNLVLCIQNHLLFSLKRRCVYVLIVAVGISLPPIIYWHLSNGIESKLAGIRFALDSAYPLLEGDNDSERSIETTVNEAIKRDSHSLILRVSCYDRTKGRAVVWVPGQIEKCRRTLKTEWVGGRKTAEYHEYICPIDK